MYSKSLILVAIFVAVAVATTKFTNVKCTEVDPAYVNITKCELLLKGRGVISFEFYMELLQKPISSFPINIAFYKKATGYRPYLYNFTMNMCDFLKVKKRYPVFKVLNDVVQDFWNLNHTCPIDHDIIVRNLVLKNEMFKYFPIPDGEYMVEIVPIMHSKRTADVQVYFDRTE